MAFRKAWRPRILKGSLKGSLKWSKTSCAQAGAL